MDFHFRHTPYVFELLPTFSIFSYGSTGWLVSIGWLEWALEIEIRR